MLTEHLEAGQGCFHWTSNADIRILFISLLLPCSGDAQEHGNVFPLKVLQIVRLVSEAKAELVLGSQQFEQSRTFDLKSSLGIFRRRTATAGWFSPTTNDPNAIWV